MVKCSAPLCSNSTYRSSDVTFHRFPKDDKLKSAWIANINREGWQPTRSSVICSTHFESHLVDPSGFRSMLTPGAIPTIFNLQKVNESTSVASDPAQGSGSGHNNGLQDKQNLQPHGPVIFMTHDSHKQNKVKLRPLVDLVNTNGDQVGRDVHNVLPRTSTVTSHDTPKQNQVMPKPLIDIAIKNEDQVGRDVHNVLPRTSTVTSHDTPKQNKVMPKPLIDLVNKNGDQVGGEVHNVLPRILSVTSHSEDSQARFRTTEIIERLTKRNIVKSKKIKALKQQNRRLRSKLSKFSNIIISLKEKLK